MWSPFRLLSLLLLPVLSTTNGVHTLQNPSQIVCWSKTRKLTWKDFQAPSKPITSDFKDYNILENTFVGATTDADAVIYDQTVGNGTYVGAFVRVQFNKNKSWVLRKGFADKDHYLPHEQLHFDIVELTGRKIRQVLARCAAQHVSYHTPKTEAEIGCLYEEEYDLQLLYDKEAGGGNNTAQAWWQAHVQRELNKLRQFESTAKDCVTP